MKQFRITAIYMAVLIMLSMIVVGCASLGVPTPQTTNERLLAGYGTVTEVRATATDLLVAKKINVDDAKNVQAQADNLRAGLDVSRTLVATDPKAADTKLTATIAGLTALRTYLTSKGSP